MKAFQIRADKRRTLTPEEEGEKADLGEEYWPPWMETGLVRECHNCGLMSWETVSLPDACEDCSSLEFTDRKPTWWEKFVHYWMVDNKFTGKDAVEQSGQKG